jgi:hypothetical protein
MTVTTTVEAIKSWTETVAIGTFDQIAVSCYPPS